MTKILLVEDDMNTLIGLSRLLRDEGYDVRGVTTGEQAIESIRENETDIVLCDFRLPDNDGLEVCKQIKRINPDIMLFIITAFVSHDLVVCAKAIGIEKAIAKPIVIDDFLDILASAESRIVKEMRANASFNGKEVQQRSHWLEIYA